MTAPVINSPCTAHPVRGRFNSWLLAKFEDDFHEEVGPHKQQHIGAFNGTVLEVGAGNGVNFRYYAAGTRVIAYEPNPYMHERLHAAGQACGLNYELRVASAEQLELADESIDAAVCTLVLCTVQNPDRMVAEILRVLKPGGRFFFLEHVAADQGTILRKVQNVLRHPWHWLFEGCHTNRETANLLSDAGFSRVDVECFKSEKMPPVIVPQIVGVAIK